MHCSCTLVYSSPLCTNLPTKNLQMHIYIHALSVHAQCGLMCYIIQNLCFRNKMWIMEELEWEQHGYTMRIYKTITVFCINKIRKYGNSQCPNNDSSLTTIIPFCIEIKHTFARLLLTGKRQV